MLRSPELLRRHPYNLVRKISHFSLLKSKHDIWVVCIFLVVNINDENSPLKYHITVQGAEICGHSVQRFISVSNVVFET